MGSGKTTVGVRVAGGPLDRPFVDSDAAGRGPRPAAPSREIFEPTASRPSADRERGAPRRHWPRRTRSSSRRPAASSSGEEQPTSAASGPTSSWFACTRLRRCWWAASVTQDHRPLLADDPLGALASPQRRARAPVREVADVTIEVGRRRPPSEITDQVAGRRVDDRERRRDPVQVAAARAGLRGAGRGRGRQQLADVLPAAPSGRRSSPRPASASTSTRPRAPGVRRVGDGEAAKTLATVEELCRAFARGGSPGLTAWSRSAAAWSPTSAGFAAAVYHRGIAVVHVPTTLLGHGRRRHRRQDRRQPARGQEPRRRVLAAGRRAVRHRRARHAAAAGVPQRPRRDGQVPLPHRRRPGRPRRSTSASPRASPSRPTSWPATSARRRHRATAGDPELRPHARPTRSRSRATTTCATARRWPIGLVFAAELAARARPHRRRAGRRAPAGAWPPTTCRRRCRPASTPTSWWS